MKKFGLNVYVQPVRDPKKPEKETQAAERVKASEFPVSTIKAHHADQAMKKARRVVENEGFNIRSVAMGPEGIVVIAFNNAKE